MTICLGRCKSNRIAHHHQVLFRCGQRSSLEDWWSRMAQAGAITPGAPPPLRLDGTAAFPSTRLSCASQNLSAHPPGCWCGAHSSGCLCGTPQLRIYLCLEQRLGDGTEEAAPNGESSVPCGPSTPEGCHLNHTRCLYSERGRRYSPSLVRTGFLTAAGVCGAIGRWRR